MKYIQGARVGAKAVLPEIHSDKAIRLLDEYRQALHDLLSPDFYPVEVAHAITRAERQRRITTADRLWAYARAWLHQEIEGAAPDR